MAKLDNDKYRDAVLGTNLKLDYDGPLFKIECGKSVEGLYITKKTDKKTQKISYLASNKDMETVAKF